MKAEEFLKNSEKDKEATEWFNKKYHTPLVTIPELVGIHESGEEEWREVPIGLILREYAQHVTEGKDLLISGLENQLELSGQQIEEKDEEIEKLTGGQQLLLKRIEDLNDQTEHIQKLEARELGFIQSMSEIEKENLGLKIQIKGRDRAEADMEKEIKRLRDEQTVAIYGSEYSKEKFRTYKKRIQELEEGIEEAINKLDKYATPPPSKNIIAGHLESLLSKQEDCNNSTKTNLLQE